MVRSHKRLADLASIIWLVGWMFGAACAAPAGQWLGPDAGARCGSKAPAWGPVRSVVAEILGCPDTAVGLGAGPWLPVEPLWMGEDAAAEPVPAEPLLTPARVAAVGRAGRILLADLLGCPPDALVAPHRSGFLSPKLAAADPFCGTTAAGGRRRPIRLADPASNAPPTCPFGRQTAVRAGWWSTATDGDLTKVGEYQDLDSSPFWDVSRLASDGRRTVELYATGTDNEAQQAGLYLFTPRATADVQYQRYRRRLDHDPLANFSAPGSGDVLVAEDMNAGQDYAIRVQELNTYIKGRLTRHLKYRVNFWLQRKSGARQAIASQHCAGGNMFGGNQNATCHVLSQTQRIDWLTMEVEPVLEGRWGPVTIEYSRPMRSFGQSDQVVTRDYGDFFIYGFSGQQPYAQVPDNFKQIDRFRLGVELTEHARLYGNLYTGNTRNKFRKTDRRFFGADVRLSCRPRRALALTGYAHLNRTFNEFPPFFVDPEGQAMSDTYVSQITHTVEPQSSAIVPRYGMRTPIDYSQWATGIEASIRPWTWTELARGLSINAGCEYGAIQRDHADYTIEETGAVVDERYTGYVRYWAGVNRRWSPAWRSFLRYQGRITDEPLFGLDLAFGQTNTRLPESDHRIDLGGAWTPSAGLIATATVGLQYRSQDSDIADFAQANYPMTFTVYYAPTSNLSLSAGYGRYSNWIDQDILFPGDDPATSRWDRLRWNYGGLSQVLSVGGVYVWTPHVTLSGGAQYVWSHNAVDPLGPWPDLADYFDVVVDTTRYHAGIDWWLRDGISAYFRYVFEDYEDRSVAYNSGTAHTLLVGASAVR